LSFSEKTTALLGPLVGKTTAFLLSDRGSKLILARALLPHLVARGDGCRILDLDAFYSSNIEEIAGGVPRANMKRIELIVPGVGSDIEATIADLFGDGSDRALIIDSTNTLHQLLAQQNPRPSSREFAFTCAALSNWAGANSRVVVANTYEREPPIHRRIKMPFSRFFDITVSVSQRAGGLGLYCRRGDAWPGRSFFLSLQD
jgi:hypothetical protein